MTDQPDDDNPLPEFTNAVHDLVFEYHERGVEIGEMADILSRIGDSYETLEDVSDVMQRDDIQAAFEDGDEQRALEIALREMNIND